MKLLAVATIIVSATTTIASMLLIAGAPIEIVPVGYRSVEMLPFVFLQAVFTAVGALLVLRRPENRVGQLLCGTALVSSVLIMTSGLAVHAIARGDIGPAATAAWLSTWLMFGIGVTLGPALIVFPDGHVTSWSARASLVLLFATALLCVVAIAFRPGPLAAFPTIANPYGWPQQTAALDAAFALGIVAGLASTVLGIGGQIQRFRRSSGPARQQLKWFIASAVVVAVALIPAIALIYGQPDPSGESVQRWAGRAIGALSTTTLPIAVGVAILRYRLYDIDLLIRRTLVYVGVSVLLVLTYIAAVVLTGAALRPFTAGSDLAVAASTLVVVVLFQPLRERVRNFVDRRFYRSRYDAARTLDAFGARLRDMVELDVVRADLVGVVHETVQPAHAELWLREMPR